MKLRPYILLLALVGLLCQGCFTGVESTPKITMKDVRRQKADVQSLEARRFRFAPRSLMEWNEGDEFVVTGSRIAYALVDLDRRGNYPQEGDTIAYQGRRVTTTLTGEPEIELLFESRGGGQYAYRTGISTEKLTAGAQVEVPFTISLEMVGRVRELLAGEEYYIKTPLWHRPDGNSERGRKYIKVKIVNVEAANAVYPFKVLFTDDKGVQHYVLMSSEVSGRISPHDFSRLFDKENPRRNYPQINDEFWNLIIDSRIAPGMTKNEVTLAWGSPTSIERGQTHSSAYERWLYPEGRYVVFEDGLAVKSYIR